MALYLSRGGDELLSEALPHQRELNLDGLIPPPVLGDEVAPETL